MKKLILLTAFGFAGLVSAKDSEKVNSTSAKNNKVEKKDSKVEAKKISCYSYGIVIGCTNEVINDTACGETFAEAQHCMVENGALMNEFYCG